MLIDLLESSKAIGLCPIGKWLSGRALDSRPRGRGFEPHLRHCVVSLSSDPINTDWSLTYR